MSQAPEPSERPYAGTTIGDDVRIERGDFIGRDSIVHQNTCAGLTTREMFRRRLVLAYEKLWSLTDPLATYAPPQPVTCRVLQTLAATLRQWYFQAAGGMYVRQLSKDFPTLEAYFALQKELDGLLVKPETPEKIDIDMVVDKTTIEPVRKASSILRRTIAAELKSFILEKPMESRNDENVLK
jgi:hypothetical protein